MSLKIFLKTFGLILLVTSLVYIIFIIEQYQNIINNKDNVIKLELQQKTKIITEDLKNIEKDLNFIGEYTRSIIKNDHEKMIQNLENYFFIFSKNHKMFQQLRYLDIDGKELVRVDNVNEKTIIKRDLQNKSSRYYYQKSQNLQENEIYVSPLDLNMEFNKISIPYTPMIRYSMPIFVDGEKTGYIVVNYFAKKLLNDIQDSKNSIQTILLNKSGYYLVGFEKKEEFGFMFNMKQATLQTMYPKNWESILKNENKKLRFDDNYAHYIAYDPVNVISPDRSIKSDRLWYIISYYLQEDVNNQMKKKILNGLFIATPTLLILAILSYIITIYKIKDIKSNRSLIRSREKAQKASHAKSEFLANMSHEIRTPLNAIIGLTNLTLATDLNDIQKDYLTKTVSSSKNLLHLINDILDYSKIEANKITLEKIPFELDETLLQLGTMFGFSAKEKDLELHFNIDPIVNNHLIGDPYRIMQILINLIGNALKFTKEGFIHVNVNIEETFDKKVNLFIEVEDTGIGIDEKKQKKLFSKFNQADSSNTREYGGTGLGLSISKKLVELMGGEISVKSEKGKGSRFNFNIIVDCIQDENAFLSYDLKNENVLLVKYDLSSNSLNEMLEHIGLDVELSIDNENLITKLQTKSYDYILFDWMVDDENSLTSLRNIKKYCIDENTKCYILTQIWEKEYVTNIIKVNNFLDFKIFLKPFSTSTLLNTLLHHSKIDIVEVENKVETFEGSILLVEDNEINQMVARQNFKKFGLEVDTAINGEVAVKKVKENSYDMIFMDLHMPVMDGFKATSLIREFNNTIPIVALSAAVMPEDLIKTKEAGMDKHLAKPLDLDEIKKVLELYLSSSFRAVENQTTIKTENIDGINMKELLTRFDNQKFLVYESLISFVKTKQNIIEEIKNLSYDSDEFDDYMHNLKGLSGSLSLSDVFKYSSKIYDTKDKEKKKRYLPSLVTSLKIVLDSIDKNITPLMHNEETNDVYTYEEFMELLESISATIDNGGFISSSKMEIFIVQIKLFIDEKIAQELEDKIKKFDYKSANLVLDKIKNHFS